MLKINKEGTTVHETLCIEKTTFDILTAISIHAFLTSDNFISAADKALETILNCNHINSMQPEYILIVGKILSDIHHNGPGGFLKAVSLISIVKEKTEELKLQGIVLELD